MISGEGRVHPALGARCPSRGRGEWSSAWRAAARLLREAGARGALSGEPAAIAGIADDRGLRWGSRECGGRGGRDLRGECGGAQRRPPHAVVAEECPKWMVVGVLINQRVAAEVAGLVARHRHGVEDGRDAVRAAERASAERVAQLRAQAPRERQDLPPLGSERPGKPPGSAENGAESGSAAGRAPAELSRHVPGRAASEPGGRMYGRASADPGERTGRARDSGTPPGSARAGNPVVRRENGVESGGVAGRISAELSRHLSGRAAPEPGGRMYGRASAEPGERSGRVRDSGAPPGSARAGNPVLRGENGADLDEDFSGRSWLR